VLQQLKFDNITRYLLPILAKFCFNLKTHAYKLYILSDTFCIEQNEYETNDPIKS